MSSSRRWTGVGVLAVTVVTVLTGALSGCSTQATASSSEPPSPAATASPSTPAATPSPTPTPSLVRIVGLGDSVTSGEHCDCDDYVTGFAQQLAARDHVRTDVANDGASGSTGDELATDLAVDDDLRADVARADVVVVTIGANDLYPALDRWRSGGCPASCSDPEIDAMDADLDRVLTAVDRLSSGHARVLVTTYWNVFTDGDPARQAEGSGYLDWSDEVTRQANAAIARSASRAGAGLVDLYTPFKGAGDKDPTDLLAADGDHPNAAGTRLISAAVLTAYESTR